MEYVQVQKPTNGCTISAMSDRRLETMLLRVQAAPLHLFLTKSLLTLWKHSFSIPCSQVEIQGLKSAGKTSIYAKRRLEKLNGSQSSCITPNPISYHLRSPGFRC